MDNTTLPTNQPPVTPPPKKHIARTIAIIAGVVVLLLAGALAFTVFALPQIAGEENKISRFVLQKYDDNTPAQVIEAFETAFNNNDRDAMAKCYAPDKRLEGNLQAGGLTAANGVLGWFGEENQVKIKGELYDLKKEDDTATGKVTFSYELPILGKQSLTATVSFVKQDYLWYINEFSDFSGGLFR